eukprot:3374835-Amphidinium_carterae.1
MLRVNLDVQDGLVNGARGWIDSIKMHEPSEDMVADEVKSVYVRFDGEVGKRWKENHGTDAVGINRHTV